MVRSCIEAGRGFLILLIALSCSDEENGTNQAEELQIVSAQIGLVSLEVNGSVSNVPLHLPISIRFDQTLETAGIDNQISLTREGAHVPFSLDFLNSRRTISIQAVQDLQEATAYRLEIRDGLKGEKGETFSGAYFEFTALSPPMVLEQIKINNRDFNVAERIMHVPIGDISMEATFSRPVDVVVLRQNLRLIASGGDIDLKVKVLDLDSKSFEISNTSALKALTRYDFSILSSLESTQGNSFNGFTKEFYTQLDATFKFPEIPDEELLTKVQEQTCKYFWDFAHPVSGLARERNTSGNLVTVGGSGFGVMAILVGIERGFITRQEGIDRLETIVNFLENADRFHGAWPHWMDGNTGETIPFSANDDGADLVETAFMIQGLLTARAYLDAGNAREAAIKAKITTLWEAVEWDWFTQGGQDVLYWHWSPNFGWEKNLRISGWNESLIIYVLAAASPTHPVNASVYHQGWAREGNMQNGNEFYGITLPLGPDRGGPLFFAHYSFLGLDPRNLEDSYANYWTQNIGHTSINRLYCIDNPKNFVGYSTACWGLTASDNQSGYSAHSPTNDLGVITPTAAISSLPYTPQESMQAIRHFYYILGDKIWGDYGFADAFNFTAQWVADSFLAIDQGPIIIMIENHRTALLWDLFMNNPEISAGLDKLGFTAY